MIKKAVTINGRMAGETMVFATLDPNINLHMDAMNVRRENKIGVVMEIAAMPIDVCEDLEKELKRKIRL